MTNWGCEKQLPACQSANHLNTKRKSMEALKWKLCEHWLQSSNTNNICRKTHYVKQETDSANLTQSFQDVIQRSFSFVTNEMTKIPTWPFLVVVNFWSYWPCNSQHMTLFDWDSSDKNLTKTQRKVARIIYLDMGPSVCFFPNQQNLQVRKKV